MAKVTTAFEAVRPGDVYPDTIPVGEEVTGRLAEIAAALDALEGTETNPVKATRATRKAPETKA